MTETRITKVICCEPSDMISNLPDDVINSILKRLCLRDAVRTSILSRKWRYNWTKLPTLKLDRTLWKASKKDIPTFRIKFAVILYQLLALHQGPITTCIISIPDLNDCPEIDSLMFFLSRNGIEYLSIEHPMNKRCKLSSSVFKCSQVKYLSLSNCLVNPPSTFEAFSRLHTLKLSAVTISYKSLEDLISGCPLLQDLHLEISDPLSHIEVNAPQLKCFYFGSKINFVYFKNTPLLDTVSIVTDDLNPASSVEKRKCNFAEFFRSLPVVEDLRLDYFIIKNLITGIDEIPVRLPIRLLCLRQLYLFDICLSELTAVRCLLCLVRSSPYLEEIYIQTFNDKGNGIPALELLEAEYHSDIKLNQLTKVTVNEISGGKHEMELIKLLLAKALILETMVIQRLIEPESPQTLVGILKQVTEFQRASPRARVVFSD